MLFLPPYFTFFFSDLSTWRQSGPRAHSRGLGMRRIEYPTLPPVGCVTLCKTLNYMKYWFFLKKKMEITYAKLPRTVEKGEDGEECGSIVRCSANVKC